jgi:hypothetical protein
MDEGGLHWAEPCSGVALVLEPAPGASHLSSPPLEIFLVENSALESVILEVGLPGVAGRRGRIGYLML